MYAAAAADTSPRPAPDDAALADGREPVSIAGRAVSSLMMTQGIGDLYRIYSTTSRDGVDYNLAFVPSSFNVPHTKQFDTI